MKPNDYPLTRRLDLHIWKDPCASVEVVNAKDLEALLESGEFKYKIVDGVAESVPCKVELELKPADQRVSREELNEMAQDCERRVFRPEAWRKLIERIEKFGVKDE